MPYFPEIRVDLKCLAFQSRQAMKRQDPSIFYPLTVRNYASFEVFNTSGCTAMLTWSYLMI